MPDAEENVSRETKDKLSLYLNTLLKWQTKINLISNNTIEAAETRHIADSLQLQKFIPSEIKTLIDLGSGGGLPGIPLAITTNIKTYLVESDKRKSIFLEEIIRQTKINASVINERIEDVKNKKFNEPVLITARALAEMKNIFELINSFLEKNHITMYKILLLKGKNVSRETVEAEKHWKFNIRCEQSETDTDSTVVIIDTLKKVV